MKMKTIDIFPWNNHFNIGLEFLDTQHSKFVAILNRLANLITYKSNADELNCIFDELIEYTLSHFQAEETIWYKYLGNDVLTIDHKKIHQKFIDKILQFKKEQEIRPFNQLSNEVLAFLVDWLVSHILNTDRKMAYIILGLESGLDINTAKNEAENKLNDAHNIFIELILSIYSTLFSNTIGLMKEQEQHQKHEETIIFQDKYLQLFLELSSSFINLPLDQIDLQINDALKEMAIFVGADRAYIFDYNFDLNTATNTYEWCNSDIEPHIKNLQNISINFVFDWPELHSKGKYVIIKDVQVLQEGELKVLLSSQDIKSLVTFPLFENNKCIGFVGFDAVKKLHKFTKLEIELLGFFSRLLSNIANKKRIETELQYERSFLKTLIQDIPDLIWLKNKDGVYLACNNRFEDFFGAKESEIIGKTDYDFIEKSQADRFRENDNKVLLTKKLNINEEEISFAKDGHKEVLYTLKTPFHDSNGNFIGVLGVGRDITATKKLEKNLILERNRFESYLYAVEAIIVSIDINGCITLVNRKGCDLLGYSQEELIGKQWFDFCLPQPEGKENVYPVFLEVINGNLEGREYFENNIITKNKEKKLIAWHNSFLLDESDKIIGTLSAGEDITQKRVSENKLHLAASVFTHSHEGIIITSSENKIIDVNHAVEVMTGYLKEELIGQNPKILRSGKHSSIFYKEMWEELTQNSSWTGEIWNKRKDGTLFPEMLTISAVKDDFGKLIHYVALFADISGLKEQQKHLEYIAHYDALTGLPNRILLSDRLHQAMLHAHRNKSTIAIIYLDLDGFKEINDSYGHSIGDKFLTVIANRMKKTLRECDTIARLGGDEFVAVLHDLKKHKECRPMINRLLQSSSKTVTIEEFDMKVTASIGVAFFDYNDTFDADQLLRFADQAMYQAKLAGKNRFHIFDAVHDENVRTQHANIERIENALKNNEFMLYYQPKVNMKKGTVVGLEALIRWNHKTKGILTPGYFLPMIEGDFLSIQIGEWVLKEAFEQIEHWKKEGLDITVSINIDALHLLSGGILNYLKKLLKLYPTVKSHNIVLEVLETSAIEDIVKVSQIMQTCKEIGINFALDDFGTGYSSLTYLKRLPVSELKIDQSFVRDMLFDTDDLAILEGIISLSAAFRRNIIAEGVENIEQGEILLQLGCEVAQGYFIARPMPAKDILNWINTWQVNVIWTNVSPIDRDDIYLLHAKVEHSSWIKKIMSFLTNNSFTLEEQNHRECRFSEWLYGKDIRKYENKCEFQSIIDIHFTIHEQANKLIRLKKSGLTIPEDNIKILNDLSKQLIDLLNKCYVL
jgi:diguanylate cyclase (GGDEF)-like protein/hemerythrin-like metal-binding protein/PAS domain S-box-containing protein